MKFAGPMIVRNYIGRHDVIPSEVEEVLFGRPVDVDDQIDGSTVVMGKTDAGRYLLVAVLREETKAPRFL